MQRRDVCRILLGASAVAACPEVFSAPREPDGFVRLPGGECVIGSPAAERQRGSDEQQHTVRLSPFFMR